MDVLTRWGQSFHNVYLYQIAMTYTLNILSFYMAIIPNKAEFLKKKQMKYDVCFCPQENFPSHF